MSVDRDQYVFAWLEELANEQEQIIESNLGAKYKLMLLMTYIDIFSQVWDMFSVVNETKQRDRFKNWIDAFLIDSLDESLTSDEIYNIRNSLLHFAALPNVEKPIIISEKPKSEVSANYPDVKIGNASFLVPSELHQKFVVAVIDSLDALINLEVSDPNIFSNGMNKLYKKLSSESAFAIH